MQVYARECRCPWSPEALGEAGVLEGCEPPDRGMGLNLGPLQEQYAGLTLGHLSSLYQAKF